jgi:hypothetical protein
MAVDHRPDDLAGEALCDGEQPHCPGDEGQWGLTAVARAAGSAALISGPSKALENFAGSLQSAIAAGLFERHVC